MTGIVVITHGRLAGEFVKAAMHIYGDSDGLSYIEVDSGFTLDKICDEIDKKIKSMGYDEYIVFTDVLGGAPCTSALRLIKKHRICVISGINLPMLLSAIHNRKRLDFNNLVRKIVSDGKNSIIASSDLKL